MVAHCRFCLERNGMAAFDAHVARDLLQHEVRGKILTISENLSLNETGGKVWVTVCASH